MVGRSVTANVLVASESRHTGTTQPYREKRTRHVWRQQRPPTSQTCDEGIVEGHYYIPAVSYDYLSMRDTVPVPLRSINLVLSGWTIRNYAGWSAGGLRIAFSSHRQVWSFIEGVALL